MEIKFMRNKHFIDKKQNIWYVVKDRKTDNYFVKRKLSWSNSVDIPFAESFATQKTALKYAQLAALSVN